MNTDLIIAVASLCAAVAIVQTVLLLRERKAHKAFRVEIKKDMNRMEVDHRALRRLSQILNFRHGGVGAVLASHRRCEQRMSDLSDVDIRGDRERVDRFLVDLVDDELTHVSERQRLELDRSITPKMPSQTRSNR